MTSHETSLSLLDRAGLEGDTDAWERLHALYVPVFQQWLRRHELQAADRDDLVQDVLTVVHRELPKFDHNGRPGAFRAWLKQILIHRLQNFWRKQKYRPTALADSNFQSQLAQLKDEASASSRLWNQEHDRIILEQVWQQIQPRFSESTCRAFQMIVVEGQTAAEAAKALGISANAALIAKSRVLKELRAVARGLIED